jgi:hypothetical protein
MDGIGEALRLVNIALEEAKTRQDAARIRKADAFRTCLEAVGELRNEWESLTGRLGYRQAAEDKANPHAEAPSLHSDDVLVQPDELHDAVTASRLAVAFSNVSAATEPLSRVAGDVPADGARAILRVLTENWVIRNALDGKPLDPDALAAWNEVNEAMGTNEGYNLKLLDNSLRLAWDGFARKAPADAKGP